VSLYGSFNIGGTQFNYEIISLTDTNGNEWGPSELEEHIETSDQIYYKAEPDDDGETYYRWIAGPFDSMDQIEAAIIDEIDAYEGSE